VAKFEIGKDPKEYDMPDGYTFSSGPDGRVKMTPYKERKPRRAKKPDAGKTPKTKFQGKKS
jgi:hypothetical protein